MEINEMSNNDLFRNYACLLKQIANNNKLKKEFEEEMKTRFENGEFSKEENIE